LRVVHLGTHGFFESPARIAALRAAIGREEYPLTLPMQAATDREDDRAFELEPLLRSGVVLACGGRDPGTVPAEASADTPPREDGILTAEEVMTLDLWGTELVVLSACDTGLGHLEWGQGVLGLDPPRALGPKPEKLPDGARPVPPSGPGGRSDPSLWAAFVLGGDPR
jgi:CHAT domain-containing protein